MTKTQSKLHLEIVGKGNATAGVGTIALETRGLNVWFHASHILKDIAITLEEHSIAGIIGPSGGGKSTLLRSLNRINDEVDGFRSTGEIDFNGINIYGKDVVVHDIRREIGMIFQRPCVFPRSIFENVIFGARHHRKLSRNAAHEIVEEKLKAASLWKEVSGRLHDKAATLSLGQQQRLCIARALAVEPKVLLMDEPTSALDHRSAVAVEELITELKERYTIAFVTHNIEQARRISDTIIFLCDGKLIEQGKNEEFFSAPSRQETREYLTWKKCEC